MKVDAASPQPFTPPTLALMHAGLLLTGIGTLLLGPILPVLARNWHLSDAHSGLMPLAQFAGSTIGGLTVSGRLQRSLLVGILAAAAGVALFAFAAGLPLALTGLFVGGFGIGRTITAINIVAGSRYTLNRGRIITWLNFSWGFGALLSPLFAAWFAPRLALATPLFVFAGLFLLLAIVFLVQLQLAPQQTSRAGTTIAAEAQPALRPAVYVRFILLLLLYGGLETSLAVWLTTYALRYAQSSLVLSEYTLVLLLFGLTSGRAASAWLLRHITDRTLQLSALALSIVLASLLIATHSAGAIAIFAVLLGIALAPVFPSTFSLLMDRRPPARQAGAVIAASGVGAAAIPWLMGVVSTRTGSLQLALLLPIAAAAAMLLLSLRLAPVPALISAPRSGV